MVDINMEYCGVEVKIKCVEPEGLNVNTIGFLNTIEQFLKTVSLYETVDIKITRSAYDDAA